MQPVLPASLHVSFAHPSHFLLSFSNWPAGQSSHVVLASFVTLPLPQSVHPVLPASLHVSGPQPLHVRVPLCSYSPAGHAVHVVLSSSTT